jgi:hypothetical protein
MSIPTLRYLAGLGLAAGLLLGCQDFLGQDKGTTDPAIVTTNDDAGSLSLSIKDDPGCRDQWRAILDARSAGHADSASEASFLATCVKEVVIGKDQPKPVIPPALLPDSGTRCKWIVAQIDGGRDSLTVSYKKYCPDDCRILLAKDSISHERLCHDSIKVPPKDTGVATRPVDDTCRMLREKLAMTKPGEPGRAELEHMFALRKCGDLPKDTVVAPPRPDTGDCAALRLKLSMVKPGEPGRTDLERMYAERCKDTAIVKPPLVNCDSLRKQLAGRDPNSTDAINIAVTLKEHCPEKPPVILPPKDSLPPRDSICMDLKLRMSTAAVGSQERIELEAAFKAKCMDPIPPLPPAVNCDELRKKLAGLDPASADYQRIAGTLKEHCPEVPVVK